MGTFTQSSFVQHRSDFSMQVVSARIREKQSWNFSSSSKIAASLKRRPCPRDARTYHRSSPCRCERRRNGVEKRMEHVASHRHRAIDLRPRAAALQGATLREKQGVLAFESSKEKQGLHHCWSAHQID
eukprot:4988532-Pleurochrysis_carterae.AAC.4